MGDGVLLLLLSSFLLSMDAFEVVEADVRAWV